MEPGHALVRTPTPPPAGCAADDPRPVPPRPQRHADSAPAGDRVVGVPGVRRFGPGRRGRHSWSVQRGDLFVVPSWMPLSIRPRRRRRLRLGGARPVPVLRHADLHQAQPVPRPDRRHRSEARSTSSPQVLGLDVVEQGQTGRVPAEESAAGVLDADMSSAKKPADEPELLLGVLGSDRGHGDVEHVADGLRNLPGGGHLLGHGVRGMTRRAPARGQAGRAGPASERVHRRPRPLIRHRRRGRYASWRRAAGGDGGDDPRPRIPWTVGANRALMVRTPRPM